jgi:hypothetical protein
MRFGFTFLLLCALNCQALENYLKPSGQGFPITENYTVVIPQNATVTENYAADLLITFLSQITQKTLTKKTDDQVITSPFISVGPTLQLQQSGLPSENLAECGYSIQYNNGNWYLLGGSRSGPTSAVLSLLEEDGGWRYYVPGGSYYTPVNASLTVVPRVYVPQLQVRDPFYKSALDSSWWSGMNKTNPYYAGDVHPYFGGRFRYSSKYFVHTMSKFFPASEYGSTHPEYFPLINGQRAITDTVHRCLAHTEMVDIVYQKICDEIVIDPGASVFSISQIDIPWGGKCECTTCKYMEDMLGYSGVMLMFANAVAAKLEVSHPDKKVSILAYHQTFKAPICPIMPRSNVIVVMTSELSLPNLYYPVAEDTNFMNELDSWAALGSKFQFWDYTADHLNYPLPLGNIGIMDSNINTFVANNAVGIMMQGPHMDKHSSLEAMRMWILAKKLWDPSRSLLNLSNDFINGYYGAAAPYIQAYLSKAEEYAALQKSTAGEDTILPPGFVNEAMQLLESAKTAAAGNQELLDKLKEEELCVRYLYGANGLQNPADTTNYLANLDWLAQAKIDMGIIRWGEAHYDRIYEWKRDMYNQPYSGNTITPMPLLYATPNAATVVEDVSTPSGLAIKIPAKTAEISTRYQYSQFIPKMQINEPYLLRIRYRVEPDTGVTLQSMELGEIGWRLFDQSGYTRIIGDQNNTTYTWQNIAILKNTKEEYSWTGELYISPLVAPPITDIYLDALEIIPVFEYQGSEDLSLLPVHILN